MLETKVALQKEGYSSNQESQENPRTRRVYFQVNREVNCGRDSSG